MAEIVTFEPVIWSIRAAGGFALTYRHLRVPGEMKTLCHLEIPSRTVYRGKTAETMGVICIRCGIHNPTNTAAQKKFARKITSEEVEEATARFKAGGGVITQLRSTPDYRPQGGLVITPAASRDSGVNRGIGIRQATRDELGW